MNRTGGRSDDPRSNLTSKRLLGKIEKGMGGTEEIHATIRRTTSLEVLAHVLPQTFVGNPERQGAH
jgi:hypothetical protein